MIYKNLTYRMLDSSDKDMYYTFVKSFSNYYHTKPNSGLMFDPSRIDDKPSIRLHTVDQMMEEPDHYRIAGAFDGDNLVSTTSGYFPDNHTWYAFNQFSKTNSSSLLSAAEFQLIAMKVQHLLIAKAEEAGIFKFYTRRTLKLQDSIDKIELRIANKKYIEFRYEKFYDGFYPPGVKIDLPPHNFYKVNSYSDSLIIMYCLKQSEREKILKTKFPECFS